MEKAGSPEGRDTMFPVFFNAKFSQIIDKICTSAILFYEVIY
jgi:hypothetical protein